MKANGGAEPYVYQDPVFSPQPVRVVKLSASSWKVLVKDSDGPYSYTFSVTDAAKKTADAKGSYSP